MIGENDKAEHAMLRYGVSAKTVPGKPRFPEGDSLSATILTARGDHAPTSYWAWRAAQVRLSVTK